MARGACEVGPDGYLLGVRELTKIEKDGAAAKYTDASGSAHRLTGDEPVSMNMWGFNTSLFPHLREQLIAFLKRHGQEEKSELYIPMVVNDLVSARKERCKVLRTNSAWFGVTYREDRPLVVEGIRGLIARGEYPEKLWI